ncbi:MAG: hypothetical protein K2O48_06755 [Prevotella sp.]|nr:hypothetical protein [Prevotella sp.]
MKKVFTLLAFLTCFLGAKAEWVEDYKVDYSTYSGFPFYVMGYVPEWIDGVMTDLGGNYRYVATVDDKGNPAEETSDVIVKTHQGVEYYRLPNDGTWHQYFIANEIPTEIDGSYTIKAMVRASETCTINVNMQWNWSGGSLSKDVTIGTEWAEVEWEYSGIAGTSCWLVAQPNTAATIEWKYLTVSHNAKAQRPIEWLEQLTNGDAEKSWKELGLDEVKFDDMDNNFKICAWGKSKGRNVNMHEDGKEGSDPFPADIEEEDNGNHVFVVHAALADSEEGYQWDNQFWIQSPKSWKAGTQVKVHFRYKASQDAEVETQTHHQKPSDYLIWHAIGNVNFTTEWQDFDKTITFEEDMNEGWSIAFNLNAKVTEPIDFYFDDLSWQIMKLDEGYFVAGSNPTEGLEYDLDNAVQFVYDEDEECYVATVGEKNAYVSQVMISTIRGNDAAFKGATLKPEGEIVPGKWLDYKEASLAKLNLPGVGIWNVFVDPDVRKMSFELVEGSLTEKPEINPNPTVVVVKGQERDDLSDNSDGVREEEGGTGEAWDNQFFIVANRELQAGEETVVEFKYFSTVEAKTTTQCHVGPGEYKFWNCIGDVVFTPEEQTFSKEFTIPADADGMKSIAFNMAEIKGACDYTIKDIVWKLKDGSASLIDQTGTKNFYVKEGADTAPYEFGTPSGISNIVTNNTVSTATYNVAGQRVSNDYKGIVIKNGKKYIVK